LARAEGEGWHLPPQRDARPDGVTDPAGVAWLRRTFTAHPRRTMQQPVRRAAPRCAGGVGPAPHLPPSWRAPRRGAPVAPRGRGRRGRDVRELDAVHDAMVTAPRALTDVLLDPAATP